MSTAERQTDATLCRRIYAARGWTDFWRAELQGFWVATPSDGPRREVPRPDVNAGDCLELLKHLHAQPEFRQFVLLQNVEERVDCLLKWGNEIFPASGATFEQAFARAAAEALEAICN